MARKNKTIVIQAPSKKQSREGMQAIQQSIKKHGKVVGIANSVFNPFSGYNKAMTKYAVPAAYNGIKSFIGGSGDYVTNFGNVKSNACTTPQFKGANDATISRCEYIGDIVSGSLSGGSTVFTQQSFSLNPAQSGSFPWLSSIASNYEQYDIQGMVYHFKSTSGDATGVNTALGSVIMATQYDPTKPSFQSKLEMEDYFFASSCKPSQSMLHAVECNNTTSPTSGLLYTRSGSLTGTDLRWSDFGKFTVATQGMPQAGVSLGELWVTYKVRLIKPKLPITIGYGGQIASGHLYRTGVTNGNVGTTEVRNFGPLAIIASGNTITWQAIPKMNYFVSISIVADTSVTSLQFGSLSGLGTPGMFRNGAAASQIPSSNAANTASNLVGVFDCTLSNVGNVSMVIGAHVISGNAAMDIYVMQIDETVNG